MPERQYVLFKLGDNEFGLPIESVQEIIRTPVITAVPETESYIKGIINLRNRIITIIDLCERLNITKTTNKQDSRIIVVNLLGKTLGLIVDNVTEVLKVNDSLIENNIVSLSDGDTGVEGVIRLEKRLVILLKMHVLINHRVNDELISELLEDRKERV